MTTDASMHEAAPDTFYAATAVPRHPRPRLTQEVDAAVCVVGGGFAGLWTARALLRRGHEAVLLDGGEVAGEASGRNAGLVSAGFSEHVSRIAERVGPDPARALYALSREGMETVRGVLAQGAPGVEPVPGRLIVRRYNDPDGVRREADLLREQFGHELLVWPTERVRATLRTPRYYQALHDADAFSIHPLNLALALAAEVETLGGRIYEHSAVVSADLDGIRKLVSTKSGRVRSHHVVFCGSAFLGEGFPALARTILPLATYLGVSEPMGGAIGEAIRYAGAVADTRRAGDYYRVLDDRLLWGGRLSTRLSPPRRLGRRLARDAARVYPQLKGIRFEHAWAGTMGYAIHKMPQIGMLRPGVWIASAFGGHGLNTTAMAGELIGAAIAEHDERWRLFIPFGLVWAGGAMGRRVAQALDLGLRLRDRFTELRARFDERRAARRAVAADVAKERAAVRAERARKAAEDRAVIERDREEAARLAAELAPKAQAKNEEPAEANAGGAKPVSGKGSA